MGPITELTSRYRLESLIAAGGVGEVWRADDQLLDRRVAVKLLRPEYVHDPVILARFRAEAHYEGQLSHPGIAQVYDYAEAGPAGPAYLVLELVDGPSLAALLATGPLPPRRTADVLAQAAQALHAAHHNGVLHRDIKPANLLIAADGRVKMTDFGIAYSRRAASLTNTGALIGTMAYLAPERVSGQSATPATDLYALGVVGYECVTGRPPFEGEPLQVALAHRDKSFPPFPDWCLRDSAGVALAELIMDMTAKDPDVRPGSAAEVAARAAQIREGGVRPVPARPAGGRAAVDRGPRRRLTDRGAGRHGTDRGAGRRGTDRGGGRHGTDRGAGHPGPGRRRLGRVAGTLVAASLVAVFLVAVVLALAVPHRPQATPAPPRPAASSPASRPAGAHLVSVTAALVGQPVSVAEQRLHARGLRVLVQAQPDPQVSPGTVLQVSPTGRLPVGQLVLLTVAVRAAPASSSTSPSPASPPSPGNAPPGRAKHNKGPPPGQGGTPG